MNNHKTSMELLSEQERIFYFHGFIYFLESELATQYHWRVDGLLSYLCNILLIFDRILIPAEHITISQTPNGELFKYKFFSSPFIRSLIENEKIVTSIWSQASDKQQHLDASERYLNVTGCRKFYSPDTLKTIKDLRSFKRDPGKQSHQAKSKFDLITNMDLWGKTIKKLEYIDGDIQIHLSHEMLMLGNEQGKFSEDFLREAKDAYIAAMPTGNGRIYRGAVLSLETFENQIGLDIENINDFLSPFCLTRDALVEILQKKLHFVNCNNNHFNSDQWILNYVNLISGDSTKIFKEQIFAILSDISRFCTGDVSSYIETNLEITQNKSGKYELVAEATAALILLFKGKFEDIIKFLGKAFDYSVARKKIFISKNIREQFNDISYR